MRRRYSAGLWSLVLLAFSCLLSHAEPVRQGGRTLQYRITSHGLDVGEMKTVLSPAPRRGSRAVRFESDLAVKANLLLYKVNSRSREDAVIGDNGTLSYRRRGEENGNRHEVDADYENGVFRFKLRENGTDRSVLVPRSGYDFTTMDCPETTLLKEGDSMEIRLLDLEHARVVRRRYHWRSTEEMEVGGRRLTCRVIDFSDPDNSCRRWISSERGVIIVRQDGKGKGGSYSLRMVSVQEAPA